METPFRVDGLNIGARCSPSIANRRTTWDVVIIAQISDVTTWQPFGATLWSRATQNILPGEKTPEHCSPLVRLCPELAGP